MKLNPTQFKAVTHPPDPLLIVAGAGTGKTTVLTERIKYLITTKHIDPTSIFAATFTQKAADEMLSRLDTVMPLGYTEPWLGTFHSLCDKLLRTEGLEIGLNSNFTILTKTDQWLFIKEHLSHLKLDYYRPLGNPNKFISALINFFSRLQDEDILPVEFHNFITKLGITTTPEAQTEHIRLQELNHAYEIYHQLKRQHSLMDFGDLITLSLKLFRERPNIKDKYQSHFQHILVDEFQDTNYAQFELLKLLAPPESHPPLTVVGDDDQSIYKFRGASITNILEFKHTYPQAKEVVLTQNYRSSQAILDAAYASISHNNPHRLESVLGIQKHLTGTLKTSLIPQILEFPTTDDEVAWTVNQIINRVSQSHVSYQDIAILTRSNGQLAPYAQSLKNSGIPYQLISNRGLFDQPEIQSLIHFLYAIVDPTDALHLLPLTQLPILSLDPKLVLTALNTAKRTSTSLWDQLDLLDDPAAMHFTTTLNTYQQLALKQSIGHILYQFVLDTGFINQFIHPESLENQLKIKNLNHFFSKIKQFESVYPNHTVISFLDVLDNWLEAGENPGQAQIEDVDTVKLLTIHSAKGLEFNTIFTGSLIAGRFPSTKRKDPIEIPDALVKETLPEGNSHLEEERRLFYVALTRAKEALYLTYALDVGGSRTRNASGFLSETNLPIQKVSHTQPLVPYSQNSPPPLQHLLESGQFEIKQLSYSKIDTFKVCPLKFKYRYLLHIPARPHHSLSFGRTIHTTLQLFHEQEMKHLAPTKQDLFKLYQDNFIDEGYDSREHRQERFKSGQDALGHYFDSYKSLLGQPILLEQEFRLKINGVNFTGKIDRIDNDAGQYAIVDYKTGSPKDQKHADRDQQLTLYALAAKRALNLKAQKLSLYYLEGEGKLLTTTRTDTQLQRTASKLEADIENIKQSSFAATPSEYACGYCEYRHLCPFAFKKAK